MADAAPTISDLPPEPASTGHGATILIVEDDAAMRMMLREALEEEGYETTAARDARDWAQELGAVSYISKPVSLPSLVRRLEALSP